MDIQQRAAIQVEIRELETQLETAEGMDKMTVMDEILELRQILGSWSPPKSEDSCISCSG